MVPKASAVMRGQDQNSMALNAADLRRTPELASLARNLAHQRWAEAALVESEERYRIVAETAIDAIVTIDETGEILFVNRSAERIFGYSTAEMLERNLTLLVPGFTSKQLRSAAQACELPGIHKDGNRRKHNLTFVVPHSATFSRTCSISFTSALTVKSLGLPK